MSPKHFKDNNEATICKFVLGIYRSPVTRDIDTFAACILTLQTMNIKLVIRGISSKKSYSVLDCSFNFLTCLIVLLCEPLAEVDFDIFYLGHQAKQLHLLHYQK